MVLAFLLLVSLAFTLHVKLLTAKLLIYSNHVNQSKSHGNNVRDVIIVHGISVDTQTNKQTYRHRR